MDIDEQLRENLISIQEIAQKNITEITKAKLKYMQSLDFDEAVRISKIETVIIEFISQADKITDFSKGLKRHTIINEIFENAKTKINNMKQIAERQNQELELELLREFGKETTLDGILNLEEYNKTDLKILWILKEGNYGKKYLNNVDSEEPIPQESLKSEYKRIKESTLEYYNDVAAGYSRWRATFQNICYITHGIIDRVERYDDMHDIDKNARIGGKYFLNNIAFINVKKAPGGNVANGNLVTASYIKHKDFLHKQIDTINPDIIFECSGVAELRKDLFEDSEIDKELNYVFNNGRLIINSYHPAYPYRTGQSENYVDSNLKIVRKYFP